jgi:regulator of protease activity HflC (stomatin/prohibitin superfamily)
MSLPFRVLCESNRLSHFRKDARLPEQLQRAMAAEAEASREARAKVIAADGEMRASKALKEASTVIDQSPSALQLRYLQASLCLMTLNGIFR